MKSDDFFQKVTQHLEHAKLKHPTFATSVGISQSDVLISLYEIQNKQSNTLADILTEEVYEFLEEVVGGNVPRAIEEACDIVAVLIRAIESLEERKGVKHHDYLSSAR